MTRPSIGDYFTAFFAGRYAEARVVEWRGRRCYFDNGHCLIWGGDHVGFAE